MSKLNQPILLLDEHEKRVSDWAGKANPYELNAAVKTAVDHEFFDTFKTSIWDHTEDRKFGTSPHEDLLQFDMWLKKKEISDKKAPAAPVTPSPPKKDTAEIQPPAENPELYKEYWKQFHRKDATSNLSTSTDTTPARTTSATSTPSGGGWTQQEWADWLNGVRKASDGGSSAPTPTGSGKSSTGITPDCKRKLVLEGGATIYIFIYIYINT